MRFILATFLLLTFGGCYFLQGEWGPGGLEGNVKLSASQTTIGIGETVNLELRVKVEELKGYSGKPDGFIHSPQAASGPFEPDDAFEPFDPRAFTNEEVLQRKTSVLGDEDYVVTFELVGKRAGQASVRGAFVYGDGYIYPTLYSDHGEIVLTVTD